MSTISIVVVGDGRPGPLGRCLASLERAGLAGLEILIAEGRSADPALERLLSAWSGEARTLSDAGLGSRAAARNAGLAAASGEVVAFLDADAEVAPGWLEPLAAALEDRAVGLVAPRLLSADGRTLHAGAAVADGVVPVRIHLGVPGGHPAVTRSRDMTVVGAACCAVRRSTAIEAGGFDEAYAGDLADADMCLRLVRDGLAVRYEGECVVVSHAHAPPPTPPLASDDARLLRRVWRGWPPDWERRLAEDGVEDAGWADCRWSGPLFGEGGEAAAGRAFLRGLVEDGRRPLAVEGARGRLAADADELCEAWLLTALNRRFVRVPASETYVHDGADRPPADPSAVGPVLAADGSAAPRMHGRVRSRPGIGWWGPLQGRSGYAAAGRGLLEAAALGGVPVRAVSADQAPAGMAPPALALPAQDFVPATWIVHHPPVLASGVDVWAEVGIGLAAPVVGATCFEAQGVPPGWVEAARSVREVWVPTGFNARTFAAAGMDAERIHVVPYPVDPAMLSDPPRSRDAGAPVTFLSVFEWTWRKGWDVLLRAWAEEFAPHERVRLLILTYRGSGAATPGDIASEAIAHLRSLGHDPDRIADIELRLDPVPHGGMPALYRSADALVLPTRGEGAGMPVLEAAAAGLPVIATAFGGHEELMHPETAFPVAVDSMVLAHEDLVRDNPLYEGMLLAEPSLASLRAQMRLVADDPEGAARRARGARELVLERFTPEAAARALCERAAHLTGRPHPLAAPGGSRRG